MVTDINDERLQRAHRLFDHKAKEAGIRLDIVNTKDLPDAAATLKEINGGKGFDDVFCFAPVGCRAGAFQCHSGPGRLPEFFAGPTDKQFSAKMNFYDVHYNSTHVMGTTGGNTDDLIESLKLTEAGRLDPAVMVTHIGGLDCAAETTLNLPKIPGGKKLISPTSICPLTAIDDFRSKAAEDARFGVLADLCDANHGLWSAEAEEYLLKNWD